MAAAVAAMARADFSAAAEMLSRAGDHPLAGRYRRKFAAKTLGAAEALAREAWETAVLPLGKEMADYDDANALLARLDKFAKDHATTKFAKSKEAEASRLSILARKLIDESPEGQAVKVREFFHGKVVKFDAKTRSIELLYDFDDPDQIKDCSLSEWVWSGKAAGSMKVKRGGLRLAGTGRYALLAPRFSSVSARTSFDASAEKGVGHACLLVCANTKGSSYCLFGLDKWQSAALIKYVAGKGDLFSRRPSPFSHTKRGWASLTLSDCNLTGQVGPTRFAVRDNSHTIGQVGLWAPDTEVTFDNLSITGILDRRWLEEEVLGKKKEQ